MTRINYIDFVKFIAILCVAIGHSVDSLPNASGFELSIYSIIYSFHMPLFAFVSGLFLTFSDNVVIDLQKKSIQLLLPYVSWLMLTLIMPDIFVKLYDSYKGAEPIHVMAISRNIFFFDYGMGLLVYKSFVLMLYICIAV